MSHFLLDPLVINVRHEFFAILMDQIHALYQTTHAFCSTRHLEDFTLFFFGWSPKVNSKVWLWTRPTIIGPKQDGWSLIPSSFFNHRAQQRSHVKFPGKRSCFICLGNLLSTFLRDRFFSCYCFLFWVGKIRLVDGTDCLFPLVAAHMAFHDLSPSLGVQH